MSCHTRHVQIDTARRDLSTLARKATSGRYKYGPPQKIIDAITALKADLAKERALLDDHHAQCGCDREEGAA